MKTSIFFKYFVMLIAFFVVLQSCSNDDEEEDDVRAEFVATSGDFESFRSWTEVATNHGPDPALGMAHGGNDEDVSRTIYVKDNVDRDADGEFPVGTLIVKDTRKDGATMEVTAMVKRGNNFNPDNNDWEWFMLMPDGSIAQDNSMELRGAQLMDGMCGACHTQASSKDYVFSK